jgi:hypothetical protein
MDQRPRQYFRVRRRMTAQTGAALFLASLVLFAPVSLRAGQQSEGMPTGGRICKMSAGDETWINQALDNWHVAEQRELLLPASPLPTIVVIDASCTFVAKPGAGSRLQWSGTPHGESVTLPDGKSVPFGVISFASPDEGKASTGFFAMSLPSVWRAKGIQSGLGLERLMDGVLLHEMTHTRQFYFVNPRMDELTKRYALSDDVGDDSIQDAFQGNAAYVADYESERDLLYAAALAPSDTEAKDLARQALAKMRARRAKWFAGDAKKWQPIDEIFLTMEGLGQWTMYAWFTDKKGLGLDPVAVLPEVRRKRNRWTQDEGLAVFLVVNRLVPSWQKFAFAPQPELVEALLERAIQ